MDELKVFTAGAAPGRPERLDVRLKLALLAAGSAVCLRLDLPALVLMGLLAAAALAAGRGFPRGQANGWRWLSFTLALVFASRCLLTPGEALLSLGPAQVTLEGLEEGALAALRLALLFLFGAAFADSTSAMEIKAGVQWFLRPLPGVPARRAGAMLGLLVRFIPMILEQAAAVSAAQRARGVENRRNPVYRTVKLVIPLMRRIFLAADLLTLAMEARCYNDERSDPPLRVRLQDWLLFGSACAALAAFYLFA